MELCSAWSQCSQPWRKTWYKQDSLSLACSGSSYEELLSQPLEIHGKSKFRQAWTECGRSRNRCTAPLRALQQPDQLLHTFRDVNSIKTRTFTSVQKRTSGWARVTQSCGLYAKAKASSCQSRGRGFMKKRDRHLSGLTIAIWVAFKLHLKRWQKTCLVLFNTWG